MSLALFLQFHCAVGGLEGDDPGHTHSIPADAARVKVENVETYVVEDAISAPTQVAEVSVAELSTEGAAVPCGSKLEAPYHGADVADSGTIESEARDVVMLAVSSLENVSLGGIVACEPVAGFIVLLQVGKNPVGTDAVGPTMPVVPLLVRQE